jgi:hypothetical protein
MKKDYSSYGQTSDQIDSMESNSKDFGELNQNSISNKNSQIRLKPTEKYRLKESLTLTQAFRLFTTQFTCWFLGAFFIFALAYRISFGHFSTVDLYTVVTALVLQPFAEWAIHVFILHLKPKKIFRFTYEPIVTKMHRLHHQDPKNLKLVFVPKIVIILLATGSILLPLRYLPRGQALTLIVTIAAILLYYEWIHYLIHSSYKPKHKLYRTIWRSHRLHHFRNERYWFGVVTNVADHVLRTFPEKNEVPLSPTAKTLS